MNMGGGEKGKELASIRKSLFPDGHELRKLGSKGPAGGNSRLGAMIRPEEEA